MFISKYNDFIDNIIEYYQELTRTELKTTNTFILMVVSVIGTIIIVNDYNIKVINTGIKLETVKLQQKKLVVWRQIEIEKLKVAREQQVMAQEIRIAELHAASNPYVIEAQHSSTPVNVFIDAGKSSYIIETVDGATEIAISMITVNNTKYTPEQRKLMTMAFHIGVDVGFPETIQALLLQETRAGAIGDRIGDTNLPMGKRSYGVMQMKVATAKKVLKKYRGLIPKYFPRRKEYKRLRDEEIIIKLIQDDEFNIRLAALNFSIHRELSKSWAQAVVAYNTGQGGSRGVKNPIKHKYYVQVNNRMVSEVRPFNIEAKLSL